MIAVIFEALPHVGQKDAYLDAAARLRPLLDNIDGFVSIERFESVANPGKVLSLSFWRYEEAVRQWRNLEEHRRVQQAGRESIFANYRLRVAEVVRDYGMNERVQVPADSRYLCKHLFMPVMEPSTGLEQSQRFRRAERPRCGLRVGVGR